MILGVKPQNMRDLLEEVKGALGNNQLLISIAAGISTTFIEEALKKYGSRGTVPYVTVDVTKREGSYVEEPTREMIPVPIEENVIVELYSK